jgi:hypothetical protein
LRKDIRRAGPELRKCRGVVYALRSVGFAQVRQVALPGSAGVGHAGAQSRDAGLRNMTDRSADDGGSFLTVEEVARLRQITPAAVRAQLRGGSLAGEQVLQGQRTVWRIPASAVRRPEEPARNRAPAPAAPTPASRPEPARPATPAPSARVEALETEVRRLRRQLAAVSEAHRRLLDAVTADLDDVR